MKKRLSLLLFLVSCIIIPGIFLKSATAQVTPDGTTNTTVNAEGNDFTIQDGDRAGGNLFHSFQDFSVPNGGSAFFNNAIDIENILSRVTGGNISNIDGLIRANGNANLFLLNPAGILFGENTRLDVGGSFYGSSASSILFEDGEFSAVDNLQQPILTINAPIGLGFRDNPGDITNRSFVQNDDDDSGELVGPGEFVGLEVLPGNNLALIGGNINFEASEITAPGGNIELGGLSQAGTVDINPDGSLSFPDGVTKADINLSNAADVDARGRGGGSVSVNARNLNLSAGEFGRSLIRAGIRPESTSVEAQAGDVTIDVAENITLDDSAISNQVSTGGVGNSGNIRINTGSIEAINGGIVSTSTFGEGNAGLVDINATEDITFDGEDVSGFNSGIFAVVGASAVGNVGEVVPGREEGNGGGVDDSNSTNSQGDAGAINIMTTQLSLTNGGQINASTFGQGNAGAVNVTAVRDITVDGEDSGGSNSGITSRVDTVAVGDAGGVSIATTNLNLTNGGRVDASTLGEGNAGAVDVTATGNITADGEDSLGFASGIFSVVNTNATGDSGGVTISTTNLNLTNGGAVDATTSGQGNAGPVNVTATGNITADGEDSLGFASGITSQVDTGAVGDAGGVSIDTANLSLRNGGRVSASTLGQGNAGDVNIDAAESIFISGVNAEEDARSGLLANALSDGDGGSVNVVTNQLTIANGSTIDVGNFDDLDDSEPGTGVPGNISIQANNLDLLDTARINAANQSEGGAGGNITLQITEDITLENNSFISARAFGNANGGNIDIDTRFLIAFLSEANGNDILASASAGVGGNINITSQAIFGLQERPAIDNNGTNDIDVSGEFGFTQIATEIRSTEIGEVPDNLVESEQTVAQACKSDRISGKSSNLTIEGKGGIPRQPIEPIDSGVILVNGKTSTLNPKIQSLDIPPLGTIIEDFPAQPIKPSDSDTIPLQGKTSTPNPKVQSPDIKPIKTSMGDILPAKGVIKTEDGQIILTAYPTDKIDTRILNTSSNCQK
ncbi:MAG: filamentous hemagglutinin N-terminal domain-containing protein [Pleurocapsa sp. MO_226.B13]|nr:filamentous hemagglutinin N-terminal domain-containing protein [Pleurocapsa sp. MO_226.B13]